MARKLLNFKAIIFVMATCGNLSACSDFLPSSNLNPFVPVMSKSNKASLQAGLGNRNSNTSLLYHWFEKHNIVFSKVEIFTPENGVRGIFALEAIPLRFPIAVIPEHMIIQSEFLDLKDLIDRRGTNIAAETRKQLETVSAVLNSELFLDDDCCLLAFRLLELIQVESETWMPYRRLCLPDRVPNVFSMTTAELEAFLCNSSASATAPSMKRAVLAVQEGITRLLPTLLILLRLATPSADASPADR